MFIHHHNDLGQIHLSHMLSVPFSTPSPRPIIFLNFIFSLLLHLCNEYGPYARGRGVIYWDTGKLPGVTCLKKSDSPSHSNCQLFSWNPASEVLLLCRSWVKYHSCWEL